MNYKNQDLKRHEIHNNIVYEKKNPKNNQPW